MSLPPEANIVYDEKPVLKRTATFGLQAGAVGAFVSAIQNSLGSHSHGALGVLTRTGGTIGIFAAMGAAFAFTEATVANTRQKNDVLNGAAAGCAAGFLAGVRARSLPMAVGSCAVMAAAVGTFDYTGELANENVESREERRKKFFKQTQDSLVPQTAST